MVYVRKVKGRNIMVDYVAEAEAVIKQLSRKSNGEIALNTSQLRKILSAITDVKNKVVVEVAKSQDKVKIISPELQMEIRFLKTLFRYQAGREIEENNKKHSTLNAVDEFIEKAKLIPRLDAIGENIDKFNEYCKYIEALVAFHKYYSAISTRDKNNNTNNSRGNNARGGR